MVFSSNIQCDSALSVSLRLCLSLCVCVYLPLCLYFKGRWHKYRQDQACPIQKQVKDVKGRFVIPSVTNNPQRHHLAGGWVETNQAKLREVTTHFVGGPGWNTLNNASTAAGQTPKYCVWSRVWQCAWPVDDMMVIELIIVFVIFQNYHWLFTIGKLESVPNFSHACLNVWI